MPSICLHRELDVPSGGMPEIIESLSELSQRDPAWSTGPGLDATAFDYTAAIEVFDVVQTGRVLVVWTATFPVPDHRMAIAEMLGHAVFRDFVEQLRHEVLAGATSGASS
jgi:hypothetical protein